MTTHISEEKPIGGTRDNRILLPLWRIRGSITLKTPLSIGSGRDVPIKELGSAEDRHVIAVVRDSKDRPYIPASSLKGALNALARESNLDPAMRDRLFGHESGNKTSPGLVEFCNLLISTEGPLPDGQHLPNWNAEGHPHTANLPHVVRNRDTGTAEDKLLFLEQVVPPGCQFDFECTARAVDETAIQALLGLLKLAGSADSPMRLGGGKSCDNGRMTWTFTEVRQVADLTGLWNALYAPGASPGLDIWSEQCSSAPGLQPATVTLDGPGWLTLAELKLDFHTPFLVYQRQPEGAETDGAPRKNHKGQAALPASSLHGALRSQAERILRTVGIKTRKGYEVPAVHNVGDAATNLDLASVLFGAPGWRSVIRLGDFLAPVGARTLTHEMVAIDRLTGGGKDSAKFNIEVLDCPTLTGSLGIDLRRLQLLEEKGNPGLVAQTLGLLAHVLRDLDEGDIALGYGAAKGYGRSCSETWKALARAIETKQPQGVASLDSTLQAFAKRITHAPASFAPEPGQANEPTTPTPTAAQGDFHNPYVFIPFGKPKTDTWTPYADIPDFNKTHHSHARYAPNTFNGRLVCRLTTKTPIFIGAGDVPNTHDPKQKQNFRLNNEIALPATSLRGALSSLHEAITRSRLRIMDDGRYSVRAPTEHALSAVGRILKIGSAYWLQMLALPTLVLNGDEATIPRGYRPLLPDLQRNTNPPFKSLFGDVGNTPIPESLTSYALTDTRRWFLKKCTSATLTVAPASLLLEIHDESGFHIKTAGRMRFLLGARRNHGETPLSKDEADAEKWLPADRQRGIVRIMTAAHRDLVETRKHEMFLPLSGEQEIIVKTIAESVGKTKLSEVTDEDINNLDLVNTFRLLPIPAETISRFERLADEMTKTQDNDNELTPELIRPYHPVATRRNHGTPAQVHFNIKKEHRDRVLRFKHGDMVFFRPDSQGTCIEEIAYSSIWRQEITRNIGEFVGEELAPISSDRKKGTLISPSELMFGFVEAKEKKAAARQAEKKQIQAFLSKVRFGFALPTSPVTPLGPITLKILSSPKPPSPAMYFQTRNGASQYVAKGELQAHPDNYALKGRKVYLHALRRNGQIQPLDSQGREVGNRMPWETSNPNDPDTLRQKVRITPIDAGNNFYFEVDFVNLDRQELASLCATLTPSQHYQHKIGMGKPIGMGSVKIEMAGLFLVDRGRRYQQTTFTKDTRYEYAWKNGTVNLPSYLNLEQSANATTKCLDPGQLANEQMLQLLEQDRSVYNAILISGDPANVHKPVHYPQLANQDIEQETYAWFVNNDKTGRGWDDPHQAIGGITPEKGLPVLSRTPRVRRQQQD